MIKLCYKEYPYKMSLDAMKGFKKATGRGLWALFIRYIEVYTETLGEPTLTIMRKLHEVADEEVVANALYYLIREEDKSIPIAEIEDAMFRVGWLPNPDDDDMSKPFPLVMVAVAYQIDAYFSELNLKKKADI